MERERESQQLENEVLLSKFYYRSREIDFRSRESRTFGRSRRVFFTERLNELIAILKQVKYGSSFNKTSCNNNYTLSRY